MSQLAETPNQHPKSQTEFYFKTEAIFKQRFYISQSKAVVAPKRREKAERRMVIEDDLE